MTAGPAEAAWRKRLAAWEPRLGAVVTLDNPAAGTLDAGDSAGGGAGPLAGVATGVKDVIDVRGLPTRNGSAAWAGAAPASRDAPVVAALRAAGAAILCKTASTELAFTDPTATLNPFDAAATPGGSSSGSGAAVGAGLLDLALGTQTAGSLCRPAAYCGAVAFKPSLGALSTEGMTPLAPPFDTIGFIARNVAIAGAAFAACAGDTLAEDRTPQRIARAPIDPAAPMTAEALDALDAAARILDAAPAYPPPVDLAAVVRDHRTVMLAEAAAAHGVLLDRALDLLRPKLRAGLEEGRRLAAEAVAEARARLDATRRAFWRAAAPFDALLAPPTTGAATGREGGTGYQHLLTPWTVFGGPLVSLPWGADRRGRPLAVMLAGPPGSDARLLALAATLERAAPPLARPAPAALSRV